MKANSANPSLIRDINRASVLDVIRREGPVSQTGIAKILNLQPSTILRIITDLLEEQLLVPTGQGKANAKGGRRATLLELNPDGAYAIGVDLNADEIIVVLLNLAGADVGEVRAACPSEQGSAKVMEALKWAIGELLDKYRVVKGKVLGIGVSVPGKVDSATGVSFYAVNFPDWRNVPIGRVLEDEFQFPVYVEGDMRCMAHGEMWFGREHDNMLCLGFFERGIGLGLVLNGKLYRGANQVAGDVGHVVVEPDGPQCSCGRRGCLEAIASERGILNKIRWQGRTLSANGVDSSNGEPDIHAILDAYEKGDPLVSRYVDEAAACIGKVLCDLVRVFDPRIIVIGGHILASSSKFLQVVKTTFMSMQPNYADFVPEIEPARFGEMSISIGSASLIVSRVFTPSGIQERKEK